MNEKMYKASDVIGILLEEITNAEFLRVAKRLSDIPSAVVRCKDCRYWECNGLTSWCEAHKRHGLTDNFYCAFGERRSE